MSFVTCLHIKFLTVIPIFLHFVAAVLMMSTAEALGVNIITCQISLQAIYIYIYISCTRSKVSDIPGGIKHGMIIVRCKNNEFFR